MDGGADVGWLDARVDIVRWMKVDGVKKFGRGGISVGVIEGVPHPGRMTARRWCAGDGAGPMVGDLGQEGGGRCIWTEY